MPGPAGRVDRESADSSRCRFQATELRLQLRVFLLKPPEIFGHLLFRVPAANGFLQMLKIDDSPDARIKAGPIIVEGAP